MTTTTLKAIRKHDPCKNGWEKLLKHLGKTKADSEPLSLLTILDSNGLDDALWCLRTMPEHDNRWRMYAVWCAYQVRHLMTDQRSLTALDVAERHALGIATDSELAAACEAAWDAVWEAAWEAARDAARATAVDAARAAAWDAARATAVDAARAAAWDAARAAQMQRLREVCAEIDALEVKP
jgi:hypothetical protein